jgi:hypothetical protein
VDWSLDGAHETGSHVDPFSTEAQGGGQTLAISKAARGDKWDLKRLARTAQQYEVGDVRLAYVPASMVNLVHNEEARRSSVDLIRDSPGTLEPVYGEKIDPQLYRALRMPDGSTFVQDNDPRSLQLRNDWPGAVPGGLNNLYTLVNDDLGVSTVVGRVQGWQQCDVHTKWVLGHGPSLLDFLPQVFWGWLGKGSEDPESARIGHSRGQFRISNMLHPTLHDGNPDAQAAGELCVERHCCCWVVVRRSE